MDFCTRIATSSRTNFALIDEHAEERAVDGSFEIGVGKENVRRLAAKFESDALHVSGGLLDDDLADRGTSGKCNLVDVRHAEPAELRRIRQSQ